MITYRIFDVQSKQGTFCVEYGPRGSGIVVTLDIPPSPTPTLLHRMCVKSCPYYSVDRYEQIRTLKQEDFKTVQSLVGKDHLIAPSEEEEARIDQKLIGTVDTSKWSVGLKGPCAPMRNATSPDILLGQDRYLFTRMMIFKKVGDQELVHQHQFDHHTVLFKGRARFLVKGEDKEVVAPAIVFIEAYTDHEITALEDDTQVACIHYIGGEKV